MSQRAFGALLHISGAQVSQIENGLSLPGDGPLVRLKDVGFNPEWVRTGSGEMRLEPPSAVQSLSSQAYDRPSMLAGVRMLPLVGDVRAGLGGEIPEDEVEKLVPVPLSEHLDHDCFVSRVSGHSMDPLFLPGDLIVVDKTCPVENNDVAVVVIDDQVMLKRVSADEQNVWLLSINATVPPIRVSRSHAGARVVGKVIQLLRSKF